jgi:SNF2 family DNA or RNA helicase
MVERGQMLLAMVMGAGKTPTTLATIEELFEADEIDKVCVVVPASLKYQWFREIKKFTNSKAIVIDGTPTQREKLWRLSIGCRYVIVNSESLIKDVKHWEALRFNAMVVDEATIIKSFGSKRSKLIKKLGAKCHYR